MKLVQLLAKELKEWPDNNLAEFAALFVAQDYDGVIVTLDPGENPDVAQRIGGVWSGASWTGGDLKFDVAEDHKTSIVTRDQWQAEREKMNKPKWIRHRGGWMPVGAATIVEVRLRCGDVQKHEACEFLWRHKDCDSAVNIMAYRVIEEAKDQEIEEVKKTNFGTITYKLEIDATEATQRIDSLVAKWGHIVSPLKWRDAIIHCQAIIEDCEREIERNVNLLDAEGLMMQKDSKKAMQHYAPDVDMSDWRNWKSGDIVECITSAYAGVYTMGQQYIVEWVDEDGFSVFDNYGGESSCDWFEHESEGLKFIRRP